MPSPGITTIDVAALEEATGSDHEFMVELLVEYLECSEASLGAMRTAIAAGDVTAIREAAHQLKGSSRAIGAFPLGLVLERVEHAARDGRIECQAIDEALVGFRTLSTEIQRLLQEAA